jgi:hypothetical protein
MIYQNYIKKNGILACIVSLSTLTEVLAQTNYTISGYIKDAKKGETIIGADIEISGSKTAYSSSNEYGFYSITMPEGEYTLTYSYYGYESEIKKISLKSNQKLDVKLKEGGADELEAIEFKSNASNNNITDSRMGVERLNIQEINKLPVLFGERDIVKAVTLLPGVKSGGDGNGSFFVRGGAADQNLILLDEVLVYNPSHLLGFFSTFNSDALKNVTMYKGNMPAQYGSRLSSVMDVQMKDGNNQNYGVSGGVGLIASRLTVEGPLVKDKGSFMISGRRTYADLFLKLSTDSTQRKSILNFYDLNAKASYKINDKHRVFFSGYLGQDNLGLANSFGLDWGNKTSSIRWNYQINPKLFSNTTIAYNDFAYNVAVDLDVFNSKIKSRIKDWSFKEEISYFFNARNEIKAGFQSIYHIVNPGSYSGDINIANQPSNYSWENALYANNTWKVTNNFMIDYGVRLSAFSVLGGEQPFYTLNNNQEIIDTKYYGQGEIVNTYINPEPRISANYIINPSLSVKAAYARNNQYMHLLSNSSASNPTDKWIPTNNYIKPEWADQVSLGVAKNLNNDMFALSVETYYKNMGNQIDYVDGANILSVQPVEEQLLFGKGRAYGIEFLVRKNTGKLTGWIGYTLARTERKIDGINNGEWYNARQDRTHDLSVVAIYELSKRVSFSGLFVYYTGNAVTFPSGKYKLDNQTVYLYTERNAYRMPAYHRLDLNATIKLDKRKRRWESELAIGVFNVYGRQNAYSITFRDDPDDANKTQAVKTSLFRFVPSITYNFKF